MVDMHGCALPRPPLPGWTFHCFTCGTRWRTARVRWWSRKREWRTYGYSPPPRITERGEAAG